MIFKSYVSNKIARKLAISIILLSSLITLVTTMFQLYIDYNNDLIKIEGYLKQVEDTYLPSLINSLWEYNDQQIEIELKGILGLPGMEYVEIKGAGKLNKVLGTQQSKNIIHEKYPLVISLKHKEIELGVLHVLNSLDIVYNQLIRKAVTILISNTIKTFIVAIFILFLVHHLVTKRLFKIANLIEEITLEPEGVNRLFNDKDHILGKLDEFEKIVDAVNTMKGGLDSAFRDLATSQKRYKRLFENSPIPLWEEDFTKVFKLLDEIKDGGVGNLKAYFASNPSQLQHIAEQVKVIDVNKAALDLHGAKTKKELLGNLDKIFTENSLKVFEDEIIALSAGCSEFKAESEVKSLNGELKVIYLNLLIDKSDSGKVIGLIATTDITKELEIEKQQIQIQKLESIGNLAGGIAHDFNNILAPILGYTEILLEEYVHNPKAIEDLQQIYRASNRAKELVKQILTFARQSDDEFKPVVVQPILKEVVKFLRSSIPTSIAIETTIKSESFILGNPTQLHQVLMNLCTNAQHAIVDDEGNIRIGLRDVEFSQDEKVYDKILPKGKYVQLTVSDDGTGINPEIIHNIFEPYYTTKGTGEGTGLGLAITYGIVERSGGAIQVESTVNRGTTFTIYWPVVEDLQEDAVLNESKALPIGRGKILLVDDEESLVQMGARILQRLGYEVTSSTDSSKALEIFLNDPTYFDLVITDMTMPKMTGDKLILEIRKVNKTIPIVLCTGYSVRISKDSYRNFGVSAYLSKPYSKKDISDIIFETLNEKS
ncbi:MAG: signal transduction histidine kinase/ActR/RegA family two-component response regulator [Desulforhopalus sp.]|jgi:signal transduction histidine kinase/ActR/RegA family two-component response regulator